MAEGPEAVARRYFEAIGARDVPAAVALWEPGGVEHVHGRFELAAPDGVEAFIRELAEAMPDLRMEVLSTTTEGDRCGVQWRASGTFAGPGGFAGVDATGDRLTLEGFDLLTIAGGLIKRNEAFSDSTSFLRQIGAAPAPESPGERRLTGAINLRTSVTGTLAAGDTRPVAEGVWLVQGQPGRCNVFLIEDSGGITLFDAGARTMTRAVAGAGARLGGIRRIVLGHGHTDHRGTAPGLGVPVICHPAEVEDAEGSGGFRYWPAGLTGLPTPQRQIHRLMHRYAWDGGPVKIAETLSEGDEIAGFRVIELPGHAPGQIGLFRESDRLALVSDCFYTVDMWGRSCAPHVPEATYNFDTEQARASIRKLAAMEPSAAWPGHAKPVTGDVKRQLEVAAETI